MSVVASLSDYLGGFNETSPEEEAKKESIKRLLFSDDYKKVLPASLKALADNLFDRSTPVGEFLSNRTEVPRKIGSYMSDLISGGSKLRNDMITSAQGVGKKSPQEEWNDSINMALSFGPQALTFGKGKTISNALRSKNFKKWFGDSKVTTEAGRPSTVYHGSNDIIEEFKQHQPSKLDSGALGEGFYFTSEPHIAEAYTRIKPGGNPNIMPVNLRIENPYYATQEYKIDGMLALKRGDTGFLRKRQQELIDKGYDGVILKYNHYENGANPIEYMIFDPNQVKSSIGNSGKYSRKSNKIISSNFNSSNDISA